MLVLPQKERCMYTNIYSVHKQLQTKPTDKTTQTNAMTSAVSNSAHSTAMTGAESEGATDGFCW